MSKAALDKLIEAWRAEHDDIAFTQIAVGDCEAPDGKSSEFNAGWDTELMREIYPTWIERGLRVPGLIDVEKLVDLVDTILRTGATAQIPSVTLSPRPRPTGH